MPVVTPIDAPPEPSSFVLMVSGLMTMGIYFLATRKKRRAALELRNQRSAAGLERSSDEELLQTELSIEQDLETIQGVVQELQQTTGQAGSTSAKKSPDRDKTVTQK